MRSLREKLAQANLKLGRQYPEPSLVYQQRGTSAGTAWLEKNEIRLNPVLLLENQQAFIDEVVPHELAHLLVWKHFPPAAPIVLNSTPFARTPSPTAASASNISLPSVATTAWFGEKPPTAAFAAAICWSLKSKYRLQLEIF